jgi:23S rRNA (guanosine2251-2'-O)-methyltransferase
MRKKQPQPSHQLNQKITQRQKPQPATLPCPDGAIIIWGRHAVAEAIKNPRRLILNLYAAPDMAAWAQDLALSRNGSRNENRNGLNVEIIEKPALAAAIAANLKTNDKAIHQGIVAIARPLPQPSLEDWLDDLTAERPLVMVLDQITDGRNIGAIMRSARAFRASAIITTERHCPDENGAMLRTASGAAEHIPIIRVVNLARAMKILKLHDFMLAGMTAEGKTPLSSLTDHNRLGIIMGAEGKGLRRLTRENADMLVRIPIDDTAESLNVSNAAAVALYAAQR